MSNVKLVLSGNQYVLPHFRYNCLSWGNSLAKVLPIDDGGDKAQSLKRGDSNVVKAQFEQTCFVGEKLRGEIYIRDDADIWPKLSYVG